MITCLAAFIIDTLIGDPRTRLHPVALIGKLIGWLDHLFYSRQARPLMQMTAGLVVVLLVILVVFNVLYILYWGLDILGNVYVTTGVEALLLSFTICPRSLASAAGEIYTFLAHHHLGAAREKVGWIVGRDTDQLDEGEIVRATVETVAENTTDGIISPLFFYALGGLPMALLYRTVNTMDSMLGYKNEKYLYFGRVAARLDDVCNFIPARITGLLFVMAAFLLRLDYRNAWRMMRRDAAKHPSPNGGYAEASVAGALDIRLGGYNSYFGKMTFRAYMGDARQPLKARHIRGAVQLMYTVTVMGVALAILCWAGRGLW